MKLCRAPLRARVSEKDLDVNSIFIPSIKDLDFSPGLVVLRYVTIPMNTLNVGTGKMYIL